MKDCKNDTMKIKKNLSFDRKNARLQIFLVWVADLKLFLVRAHLTFHVFFFFCRTKKNKAFSLSIFYILRCFIVILYAVYFYLILFFLRYEKKKRYPISTVLVYLIFYLFYFQYIFNFCLYFYIVLFYFFVCNSIKQIAHCYIIKFLNWQL